MYFFDVIIGAYQIGLLIYYTLVLSEYYFFNPNNTSPKEVFNHSNFYLEAHKPIPIPILSRPDASGPLSPLP